MRVQIIMKNAISKHRTNLGLFTSQLSQEAEWEGDGYFMRGVRDVYSPTVALEVGFWISHNLEKDSIVKRDQKVHPKLIVYRFVNYIVRPHTSITLAKSITYNCNSSSCACII